MKKILVIATSHKTRGGITSVVKAHQQGAQWSEYSCKWIETHVDKRAIHKLAYLVKGWFSFIANVPFCSLVHIHMSEPPSAIRKCLFMPLAKLFGKKVIVHFHAFSPETTIESNRKSVYRYLFSRADRVIVLSESWRKAVNDSFNLGDKVVVVFNPCTTAPSSEVVQQQNHILYAGTVNARKGYADMIKAFAKIANKYPDWKIVFAGNGEIEEGQTLSKELSIENQVVFLGWVNGADKDRAFKEATIFCLPSYAEGFPMAVLDAWAYGLPVITTPVGGIPDVAIDGENMMLFNPGDIDKLAEQMDNMICNRELRESINKESLNFANEKFNLSTINNNVRELYKSLLD
ncbi:MAG: glycosyltransferase family 4 protein [Rikenellaceae bacterium]